MNEIRVAQKLQIKLNGNQIINGSVSDYTFDRVMIKIDDIDAIKASVLRELDEVDIFISTHLGVKHMRSCVISELNKKNCIIVENNEASAVEQKREYVRVVSNLCFVVEFNSKLINCTAINISAGGIAFNAENFKFNIDDKIKIKFSENDLGKNICCDAIIVKVKQDMFAARYININPHDEDKIMKYVFKLMK